MLYSTRARKSFQEKRSGGLLIFLPRRLVGMLDGIKYVKNKIFTCENFDNFPQ